MPRLYGHHKSHWDDLKPSPSPLLSKIQFTRVFQAEKARTERTGSIFSLVVITLREETAVNRSQAIRAIERTARLYDAMGAVGKRSLGVILPESAPEDALPFSDRVSARLGELDIQARVKIYSYPMDWLDRFDDDDQEESASQDTQGHETLLPKVKQNLRPPTGDPQQENTVQEETRSEDEAPLKDLMPDTLYNDLEPHLVVSLPKWRRALDILVAAPSLAIGSLTVLPMVAFLIKLDSKGSVFYKQTRLGQGGHPFEFIKFRSMRQDMEKQRTTLENKNEQSGVVFKMRNDPRITRVGYWLRKLSIDELPQLWHVLCGDMTLIGPRPPLPREFADYLPWQRRRLDFKGGLTCLWQVNGRSNLGFNEWVRMDLQYIRHRSWWLDLSILARTPGAIIGGRFKLDRLRHRLQPNYSPHQYAPRLRTGK